MPEWERVRLGEVLDLKIDAVPVNPEDTYKISGVYSFGRGLIARGPLSGADTSYKVFHRLHSDDFVVSQLKAWEGALARVTPEFDGWFLSPQFPTFRVKPGLLDIEYLELFCKQASVWETLRNQSRGMGARRDSVSPARFLALEIPLPPLPEQRRIVARVKGMLGKVEEARGLAEERDRSARHLLASVFYSLTENAPIKTLAEVAPLVRRPVEVREGEMYPELGVRSFGRGTFHKPALSAIEVGDKKLFRIEEGDLLFNIVFAWEGAVAVAKAEDMGRVGSHRFLTCVTDKEQAEASFLNFYFQTSEGLAALGEASPGGAGRNRTLSLKNLATLAVPVPPLESQRYFQRLLGKVEAVYSQQADLAPQLDALPASILARAFAGAL